MTTAFIVIVALIVLVSAVIAGFTLYEKRHADDTTQDLDRWRE